MSANRDPDEPEDRDGVGEAVDVEDLLPKQKEEGSVDAEKEGNAEEEGGVKEEGGNAEEEEVIAEQEEDNAEEEEEDSAEDDDHSDEEEEKSDEDEADDLAIAELIFDALEESARSDERLEFAWNVMGWISQLKGEGIDILVELLHEMCASEASWDHLVEGISVDVEDPSHDMEVALRITRILDCLNLASLHQFSIFQRRVDEENLHPWKPLVVDHYVKWLATTNSIPHPERLHHFSLDCLGYDPKVWGPFASRFSSIANVVLSLEEGAERYPNCAVHATALVLSMRCLPKLRVLFLHVRASSLSSILSCLCQGILSLPKLEIFRCSFMMKGTECRCCTQDFHLALRDIANVLALSSSLKHVTIAFNDFAKQRLQDARVLVDQLRFSGSIANIALSHVHISGTKETPFHKAFLERAKSQLERSEGGPAWTPSIASFTNQSIKSLLLDNCTIGNSYLSAFANCAGIEDVSLTDKNWRSADGQLPWSSPLSWSTLFRTHPQLKSLVVGTANFNSGSVDEERVLAALVASLDLAKSLQDLTVCTRTQEGPNELLPSLEHLLRSCTGKLTLQHDGVNGGNIASICAGLKATPFLTNLQLTVAGEEMTNQTVVSILQSLQKNRTVKTFHGKFVFDSPLEVGILDSVLDDLLSSNSVLESFGLDVLLRERFDDDDDDDVVVDPPIQGDTPPIYTELLVAPITNALTHNRALKVLCLNGLEEVDPTSFELLSGMLKTNVTLERIKYHNNIEDSDAKDEIEWLLALNRYKRRCLVQTSGPFPASTPVSDHNPLPLGDQDRGSEGREEPSGDHPSRLATNPVPRPTGDSGALLPAGVWPSVLGRIATDRRADVMYHFLRRMPKSSLVSSYSHAPPPHGRSGRGLKRASPSNRSGGGNENDENGPNGIAGPD